MICRKTRKTWKQKIGKRLLKHVKETTRYCTLREVKANYANQQINPNAAICNGLAAKPCNECEAIARKLQFAVQS